MKNLLQTKFCLTVLSIILLQLTSIAQQPDTTSWYRYGKKDVWYYQKDVWAFRTQNGLPYMGQTDPAVVEEVVYQPNTPRKLNEVHFKPNTTPTQKETEKNKIRVNPVFECEAEVITKEPMLDKAQKKWYSVDDLIVVIFSDPDISQAEVTQFRNRYNVLPYREPYKDLPSGFFGFYVFRKNTGLCAQKTTTSISKEMWENDAAILLAVEPNITLRIESHSCPTNDTYFDYNTQRFLWHLDNNGTLYNSNGSQTSTSGSDAKICECWDAGYDGFGIRIGVIDMDGFEWTHEDLNGQFVDGWNTSTEKEYTSTTPLPPYVSGRYHGTMMSGTIAANFNNSKGIVGVAPTAKIVPIFMSRTDTFAVGKALEKAPTLNLDIVNMSFSFNPDYSPWHYLAQQLADKGRPIPWNATQKQGCILVASAGNNDKKDTLLYPAAWDTINTIVPDSGTKLVIGAIGTNPKDFRHSGSDGWGVGPSNYGLMYDIAAPGAFITTSSFMGKGSASFGYNYVNTGGTSFSSAIISGIAAILLSKNYTQRWDTLRNILYSTTDKVHSSTYNNYKDDPVNYPGKSIEMGYGRINCLKALNATPVGINKEASKNNFDIQVFNSSPEELTILYNLKEIKNLSFKIFDVLGRKTYSQMLQPQNFKEVIQLNSFADGVYVIAFYSNQNGILKSHKFIKF